MQNLYFFPGQKNHRCVKFSLNLSKTFLHVQYFVYFFNCVIYTKYVKQFPFFNQIKKKKNERKKNSSGKIIETKTSISYNLWTCALSFIPVRESGRGRRDDAEDWRRFRRRAAVSVCLLCAAPASGGSRWNAAAVLARAASVTMH